MSGVTGNTQLPGEEENVEHRWRSGQPITHGHKADPLGHREVRSSLGCQSPLRNGVCLQWKGMFRTMSYYS